jgi:hypothetical protein
MEPAKAKMMIHIGEFPVVEVVSDTAFRVALGPGTTFVLHLQGVKHRIKPDDRVPLYMEIPYEAVSTSIQ